MLNKCHKPYEFLLWHIIPQHKKRDGSWLHVQATKSSFLMASSVDLVFPLALMQREQRLNETLTSDLPLYAEAFLLLLTEKLNRLNYKLITAIASEHLLRKVLAIFSIPLNHFSCMIASRRKPKTVDDSLRQQMTARKQCTLGSHRCTRPIFSVRKCNASRNISFWCMTGSEMKAPGFLYSSAFDIKQVEFSIFSP